MLKKGSPVLPFYHFLIYSALRWEKIKRKFFFPQAPLTDSPFLILPLRKFAISEQKFCFKFILIKISNKLVNIQQTIQNAYCEKVKKDYFSFIF